MYTAAVARIGACINGCLRKCPCRVFEEYLHLSCIINVDSVMLPSCHSGVDGLLVRLWME